MNMSGLQASNSEKVKVRISGEQCYKEPGVDGKFEDITKTVLNLRIWNRMRMRRPTVRQKTWNKLMMSQEQESEKTWNKPLSLT